MRLLRLSVVIAPILVQVFLVVRELAAWMPIWAWYPDPGYNYLTAGAALVSGGAPALVYHPGTSFQWLVGAMELVTYSILGSGGFLADVASRPEMYAQVAGLGIAVLYLGSLLFAAVRLEKFWGWIPSLAFQLVMLWGLPVTTSARFHLWPESLALICSLVVISLLAPLMALSRNLGGYWLAPAIGVVAGIGLTAKVIFAPMIVLAILALPRRLLPRFIAGFVLSTVVIVLPVRSQLPFMWDWFTGVATQTGRHGGASQAGAWQNLITGHAVLSGFLRWYVPLTLVTVLATVLLASRQKRRSGASIRPSVALICAFIVAVLLALKESQPRDLMIVVPVLGALVAHLIARVLVTAGLPRIRFGIVSISCALLSFLALHGIVHEANFAKLVRDRVTSVVSTAPLVQSLVESGSWALGYNVWTPANALMFGANDAVMFGAEFSDDVMNAEVREAHPTAIYFDIWSAQVQRLTASNELQYLSCETIKRLIANGTFGVVVESKSHVRLSDDGSSLSLAGGLASFDTPRQIGQYWAYPVTNLNCDQG